MFLQNAPQMMSTTCILAGLAVCAGQQGGGMGKNPPYLIWKGFDFRITVDFLYLAFFYLAEAVMIMPSPRNHILNFFNLAVALSGNGQPAKCKFLTAITYSNTKIQSSAATAAEFLILNFGSSHYSFDTKI